MAHVRKGSAAASVWVVDYVDANGERHRVQRTTREKAESFLAEEIQKAKEAGPVVDNPEITLTEYRERWARRAEQELKPRTFLSYQYYFKRYVEPDLGRLKVRSINRGTVRDLLASRRGSGLAKDTVRLARAALSVVLSSAVDDGLLPSNPALGFRQARADRQSEQEKTERIRPFTEEELGTFLGVAEKLEPRCAPTSGPSHTPGYDRVKDSASRRTTSTSTSACSQSSVRSRTARWARRRRVRDGPWTFHGPLSAAFALTCAGARRRSLRAVGPRCRHGCSSQPRARRSTSTTPRRLSSAA